MASAPVTVNSSPAPLMTTATGPQPALNYIMQVSSAHIGGNWQTSTPQHALADNTNQPLLVYSPIPGHASPAAATYPGTPAFNRNPQGEIY